MVWIGLLDVQRSLQRKQQTTGASLIEETPIKTESPTPLPQGYQSGTRLPSPPSSNGGEQGEIYEDKVSPARSFHSTNLNALQEEFQLLDSGTPGTTESSEHEVKTAPLFTRDAKHTAGFCPHQSQYGVLGSLIGIRQVSSKRAAGGGY